MNENIVHPDGGATPIHDPSIIEENGTYYVFSSDRLGGFYSSDNLRDWKHEGNLFEQIPDWLKQAIPAADHIGSPDISYYQGQYVLFYQSHESETCNAATGLATSATLDPQNPRSLWIDHGLILRSRPFFDDIKVWCGDDQATFNAIDPHFFVDQTGKPWLLVGSTIGGIRLVELEPETLRPRPGSRYQMVAQRWLLQEDPVIEAPSIFYKDGFYYLMVSFNHCCQGENTRYQIRMGRSRNVTGPYLDKQGRRLDLGGGTLVLDGDPPWIGTGHSEVFSDGGKEWLVHHAKDANRNYQPSLNIRELRWDTDGWPSACQAL
ncbi:MAG: arabinan endo-1,5-alpha-L-arabinosidase [Myxococcota bacterium]|nr:arabinan endo-1,5-alpha-L-arabinosidase [Myxococcota bacterium]